MQNYRAVSWVRGDDITLEKLQQMVANDQALNDGSLEPTYTRSGTTVKTGLKLLGGRVTISSGPGTGRAPKVNWSGVFAQTCYPIITTGNVSNYERYIFTTVQNLNGTLTPDSKGMTVASYVDKRDNRGNKKKIDKAYYVDYTALGF